MTPARTRPCTPQECRARRDQTRDFLDVSDLVLGEVHYSPNLVSVDTAATLIRQARALLEEADAL